MSYRQPLFAGQSSYSSTSSSSAAAAAGAGSQGTYNRAGASSMNGGPSSGNYEAVRNLETQNDDLMSGLHEKVGALKNNNDMGRTGIMLKNTMNRLTHLMGVQSPKQMCYLIGFIMLVFFVLYWIFRR